MANDFNEELLEKYQGAKGNKYEFYVRDIPPQGDSFALFFRIVLV